jgi:hypothetical protein
MQHPDYGSTQTSFSSSIMKSSQTRSKYRTCKNIEKLEDRFTPAQFGIPWPDATHLTLSFAPDGTSLPKDSSDLFQALDAQMPREVWQLEILRAFQTWANQANINVGVVRDRGMAFGTSGPTQGDDRFGDIRIGGLAMSGDELAVSIPPDNGINGTFAGDIFINTSIDFTPSQLYAAMLHEAGHALGLPTSDDPLSPMYETIRTNPTLTQGDIAAIRKLYDRKFADTNELNGNNNSIDEATDLKYSDDGIENVGAMPVVEYGEITKSADIDFYRFSNLDNYSGAIRFIVKSKGISLLQANVQIQNRNGVVLAEASMQNDDGSVTIQLPRSTPEAKYYVRVAAVAGAEFSIGRYAIAAQFVDIQQPTAISLDRVMRGNYESLSPERIDQLFQTGSATILDDEDNINDDFETALDVRADATNPSGLHYQFIGSLNDATDRDVYRLRSPEANRPWIMTVSVNKPSINGVVPQLRLFDASQNQIPTQTIVNRDGQFAIQAIGITPNRSFFLRVTSSTAGNYGMQVHFGNTAVATERLVTGSLDATTNFTNKVALFVGQSQLFNFQLSANSPITMLVRDKSGREVYRLSNNNSRTVTSVSKLFLPGEYTIFIIGTQASRYSLSGISISDPVGPNYTNPNYRPQYQPVQGGNYVFPYVPPTPKPYVFVPRPYRPR